MAPMTSLTYRLYTDGTRQDSDGDAVLTVLNPVNLVKAGTLQVDCGRTNR
jgi:hypothetical protein